MLFIYLLTLDLMVYIAMVFKNFSPSTSLFRKQIDFHMVAIGVSTSDSRVFYINNFLKSMTCIGPAHLHS